MMILVQSSNESKKNSLVFHQRLRNEKGPNYMNKHIASDIVILELDGGQLTLLMLIALYWITEWHGFYAA